MEAVQAILMGQMRRIPEEHRLAGGVGQPVGQLEDRHEQEMRDAERRQRAQRRDDAGLGLAPAPPGRDADEQMAPMERRVSRNPIGAMLHQTQWQPMPLLQVADASRQNVAERTQVAPNVPITQGQQGIAAALARGDYRQVAPPIRRQEPQPATSQAPVLMAPTAAHFGGANFGDVQMQNAPGGQMRETSHRRRQQQRAADEPRVNQWRPRTHARATPRPQEMAPPHAPAPQEPMVVEPPLPPVRMAPELRLEPGAAERPQTVGRRRATERHVPMGGWGRGRRVAGLQERQEENSAPGAAFFA